VVAMLDHAVALGAPALRLAVLVAVGGAVYAGLVLLFARATVAEALRLVLRR